VANSIGIKAHERAIALLHFDDAVFDWHRRRLYTRGQGGQPGNQGEKALTECNEENEEKAIWLCSFFGPLVQYLPKLSQTTRILSCSSSSSSWCSIWCSAA
jgi:hypothetical protein